MTPREIGSDRRSGVWDRRATAERRFVELEMRVGRIESDIESEKGTRNRANQRAHEEREEINKRLRAIERVQFLAIGGILAIEFFVRVVKV